MNYVKDKVNQATENFQGKTKEAAAKEDKEVLKNSNAGVTDKGRAAVDYLSDKKDQKSHEGKADLHDAKADSR